MVFHRFLKVLAALPSDSIRSLLSWGPSVGLNEPCIGRLRLLRRCQRALFPTKYYDLFRTVTYGQNERALVRAHLEVLFRSLERESVGLLIAESM